MMSANDESSLDEDFGQLFEQSLKSVKPGEVVTGKVVQIANGLVTVDIGYKSEGQIPINEFRDRDGNIEVQVGDDVDVYFEASEGDTGAVSLSRAKAEQVKVWRDIEIAYNEGVPIEGLIVGKVKGGLKVDIGVAAFLPGSHADLRPTRNLDRFIGQKGRFAILKFNRSRGNVVVSRRAVLERERSALKEETLRVLEEGIILEGAVKNITDYGAFVDLGGLDGLLHITDMSWGRISHPSEVINVGDQPDSATGHRKDAHATHVRGEGHLLPDFRFAQGACRHRLGDAERIVGQRVAHGHHAQRFQRADSAAVRFERGNRGLPCGAHNTPLCHDRMIVRRAEFPIIRGGAIRRNTACGRPDKAKPRRPFGLPGFQAVISRFTLQRAGPCQP